MIYEILSPNSNCNEGGRLLGETWSGGNLVWDLSSGTRLTMYGDSFMSINAYRVECDIGRSKVSESHGGGWRIWTFHGNGTQFKSRPKFLSEIDGDIDAKRE